MEMRFDYVIVGAGSAGCVLANRLSESGSHRVALIEAGGWDRDPLIHIPMTWGHNVAKRRHDWLLNAEPLPSLNGRALEVARGKVIGGSSSTNAMAYVRGHASDYDDWAAAGCEGWGYADVLPYFKKAERWQNGEDEFRGGGGPLGVRETRFPDPLLQTIIEAGVGSDYPATGDYNGAHQEGFSWSQHTVQNGRRCSAATAYLRPALKRKNLTVLTRTTARRVILEGGRAIGIEGQGDSGPLRVMASKEVIIAAGAIHSPHLLMNSGIGEASQLQAAGIGCHANLRGVGKNLLEHATVGVEHRRLGAGPMVAAMRIDRLVFNLAASYLFGRGLATRLPNGAMAFVKTDAAQPRPDVQIMFRAFPMSARPYLRPFSQPYADGFGGRPMLLRPTSAGTVSLDPRDPSAAPRIDFNLLASGQDRVTLRHGVKITRSVFAHAALDRFRGAETLPGPDVVADDEIDGYIRQYAATMFHPAGTCKMGHDGDASAVVTSNLAIKGVATLRVVDASIMPALVGGNINAAVIMIAERAADLILARANA